jgi:hypothetical protein
MRDLDAGTTGLPRNGTWSGCRRSRASTAPPPRSSRKGPFAPPPKKAEKIACLAGRRGSASGRQFWVDAGPGCLRSLGFSVGQKRGYNPDWDCEGPMSRSCTCGGTNENCMFCFGSGILEGPRGPTPRARIRRSASELGGVAVQGLEQHLPVREVQGEQDKSIATAVVGRLGYVFCRICLRQVKQADISEHLICAHGSRGKALDRPVAVQRPTLGSRKPPKGSAVTPSSHFSRHPPEEHTICSQCGVRLLNKNVQLHFNKVHGKKKSAASSDLLSRAPDRRKTAVPTDQLKNPIFQERLQRALDATREYAHSFREEGRYGSHPSHDDYDEGKP